MEKEAIKAALTEAAEMVTGLPQHLQEKAFELAVGFLAADVIPASKGAQKTKSLQPARVSHHGDSERPAVSDLLKVCKRNPDKYVVFLHDLEDKGEAATQVTLLGEFKDYKQDKPGNVSRDLQNLSADDWAKPVSKERGAPYELRDKGRKRYAELVASLRNEQ